MKTRRILLFLVALTLIIGAVSFYSVPTNAASSSKVVTIDGKKVNKKPQSAYKGMGMVTGNGTSRLLMDYKDENPEKYWEIMNYLFNPNTGMGLSHIKIEMGSDINSSSGTEPAVMRSATEVADVTRGEGYQFAADAKTINPAITLDMLRWSEPLWVTKSKDVFAARSKWYKETLKAAYKTYGLKFDYVSANQNEFGVEKKWIIYLSKALKKSDKDNPYDFSKIKIVAADENASWDIADQMLKDKNLLKAVDVIGTHYSSWSTSNVKKLKDKYGKEVWFTEGSSPMEYAQGAYRVDKTGSGISDINGMLDIATRIITMYPGGGMNLYEFQPAIASYYSGSTYFQKQLIMANEPWSGYYRLDSGFYMAMHFSMFSNVGWQYIDGACLGDGKVGGDGHAIVKSKYNYETLTDPKTGDYSIVIANNSGKTLSYTFNVSNLAKSKSAVDIWETRGPKDDTNYYQNYLKKINTISPVTNSKGVSSYEISVKPYSMVTVTTVQKEEPTFNTNTTSSVLQLPYSDDFDYKNYDDKYLSDRGNAPRYTTDGGGAFEVVNLNGNNVLQQKITYKVKATEWGGTTPLPVTNLGDDRWTNYSVSADTLLSSETTGKEILNFVGIGARYNMNNQSGYYFKLSEDGKYGLYKDSTQLITSKKPLSGFDKTKWYNLKISVNYDVITCYINGKDVITYKEKGSLIPAGRVALYSDYNKNCFDNLKVESIDGVSTYCDRYDNTDKMITYSGKWDHNVMASYSTYNRTNSAGTKGASFSFNYSGEGFGIIGNVYEGVKLQVEIDGKIVESGYATKDARDRVANYYNYNLSYGDHKVKITVLSKTLNVDAVEIIRSSSTDKK